MFLKLPILNASFRRVYEGKSYVLRARTGEMQCFECGNLGHERLACPFRTEGESETGLNKNSENGETGDTEVLLVPVGPATKSQTDEVLVEE